MPPSVDPSKPWRLSHILKGHTSDVKSVFASSLNEGSVELLHSASRDETGRSWSRYADESEKSSCFRQGATYQGKRFQNSVAHAGPSLHRPSGTTLLGGLDSRILAYETKASFSEKPQSKTVQVLQDHYDNVCHLSLYDGRATHESVLLISSSWDCTSRVWQLNEDQESTWQHLHTLKGHERAVWAAQVVSAEKGEEKYLTASADLFVRLFHGEELKRVFVGHTDVVRAITLLPRRRASQETAHETKTETLAKEEEENLFVTASNDGSLCVWSMDDRRCPPGQPTNGGKPLKVLKIQDGGASSDLLYDVKYMGSSVEKEARIVISCGEDGLLRGWDVDEGVVLFSIPQPVTSVWSLAILPLSGDIATANSDNTVRIFTQRPQSESVIKSGGDLLGEVTEEELQEHERMCREVALAKSTRAEITERAVGASDQIDDSIDGVKYDCVLKIDVSDDAVPLSIGINKGDDVRLVSQAFLAKHSLPTSYEDQIVAFIEQVGPR